MKKGDILSNQILKGDYRKIVFYAPDIAQKAKPGQFVHVHIPQLRDRILRRPFSIFNVDSQAGTLSLVYKVVGLGTTQMAILQAGENCPVMGPLGNTFSTPTEDKIPVLIAGGYGSAANFLQAKISPRKGILLLGARSEADLILIEDFKSIGFDVRISTNDGSFGKKGFVTELLKPLLEESPEKYNFYACGPHPMLVSTAKMLLEYGRGDGELSLDQPMCCGVGACFACVIQVLDPSSIDGWRYARSCSEGPIFRADVLKLN